MKALPLLLLTIAFGAVTLRADPFELTDDFVAHMKASTNPHEFGLRDGRYYPYSTPYGRRIGYARPITDKALYRRGETPAEAEQHLRAGLATTARELESWLAQHHPEHAFATLTRTQQELLLGHAFTESLAGLSPAFVEAVLRADWDALLDGHLYVRSLGSWPDQIKNKAFGLRYIYGETGKPLRPLKK